MRENEFEKQVRDKMDQLGFDPSDAVWTAVDKEINKEKKRRIPLFWLFFLSGMSMAGGAYFFIAYKSHSDTIAKTLQHPASNNGQIKQSETNAEMTDKITKKIMDGSIKSADSRSIQTAVMNLRRKPGNKSGTVIAGNAKIHAGGSMDNERIKESGQNSVSEKGDDIVIEDYNHKLVKTEAGNVNKNGLDSAAGKTNAGIAENNSKKDSVSVSPQAKNKNQKTKTSPWQIGFTGGAGISNINQDLFNSVKTANTNYNVNAAANPAAPNNPNYTSSEIKPGFSFEAGAFVQRNLSGRISLSAGLNYHYYSAKIKTGSKGNAALYSPNGTTPSFAGYNFYQNGSLQTFNEQYHLIEIPVSANFQLNKSNWLPIIWETGLSLGYIVSSNALYYDPNANIYIANYQQPNKMQLNVATAIMFGFHLHKNEMQIGPQLQYGLTGLLNTIDGNPGHLFYGGMKISYILKKK